MKKNILFKITLITTLIFWGCNSNSIKNKKVYKEDKIGKQTWMAENLNEEEFLNGDPILECKTREYWKRAGENKQAAVKNPRGLEPKGQQIATLEEWEKLIFFSGGSNFAGRKLKSKDGWEPVTFNGLLTGDEGNGTNESGFSALPAAYVHNDGEFNMEETTGAGCEAYWWTSSETGSENAFSFSLTNYGNDVSEKKVEKSFGLSVRCIKDQNDSK